MLNDVIWIYNYLVISHTIVKVKVNFSGIYSLKCGKQKKTIVVKSVLEPRHSYKDKRIPSPEKKWLLFHVHFQIFLYMVI